VETLAPIETIKIPGGYAAFPIYRAREKVMKIRKSSKDRAAVNSELIRRPIRRAFPLFLLPTFAAFCIGFIYPFCKGVYLSFCKFATTSDAKWVGLENYVKATKDASFVHAFWYTGLFAIVSLVLINVLAFTVAYALTQKIRGSNLFRTVFFMPNLIGGIVLGYIWSMIFDGILSQYGTSILLSTKYGFWGLIILMCWQQIGYMMIIYIAGLQAVPEDMIEAAKIDGASRWQTLWHITIPTVMPSITICTFLTLTNSFKLFDQNLALNGGQPFIFASDGTVVRTTEMLALNIYNTFYLNANSRGIGQAKAVLFFILVALLGLIQLTATRRKEVQQ
jgi:raffinose/stachyose/melibiose transport system permease protein